MTPALPYAGWVSVHPLAADRLRIEVRLQVKLGAKAVPLLFYVAGERRSRVIKREVVSLALIGQAVRLDRRFRAGVSPH